MPRFKEDGKYTFVCNLCDSKHESAHEETPKGWEQEHFHYYVCPSCQGKEEEEEEEMKETWKPIGVSHGFDGIEPETFRPSHYHDAPFDVALVQGYAMLNYAKAKFGAHTALCDLTPKQMSMVFAVGADAKHLCRLGLKDNVDTELKKKQNYSHYAVKGEWLKDD